MWDKPFDSTMLSGEREITVNCPEQDLERELAAILEAYGIKYPGGTSVLGSNHWSRHKSNFCYYIDTKRRLVRFGPKSSTDIGPLDRYEKCTFYGEQQEDISDESFNAILGV